jgi:hypothetical protein
MTYGCISAKFGSTESGHWGEGAVASSLTAAIVLSEPGPPFPNNFNRRNGVMAVMRLAKKTRLGALVVACGLWVAAPHVFTGTPRSAGQEPGAEAAAFFESKIRPTPANRCDACHSAQARQVQGGLRLDTREGLRRGGNSGATSA